MRIVEKTDTFLKIENSSMSILCNLLGEFLFIHFAFFGFLGGILKIFSMFSSDPNPIQVLIWLLFAIFILIGLIVLFLWIIHFWMGKNKKQKYCIFDKSSGKLVIKKKGFILSYIKNKEISFIKQAEILKKYDKKDNDLEYKTRLVLNYGGKLYLDIFNNSLSHHQVIAESINQFLNISPEPALIVEDDSEDNQVIEEDSRNNLNDSPQDRIEKRRTNYLENQKGWWF